VSPVSCGGSWTVGCAAFLQDLEGEFGHGQKQMQLHVFVPEVPNVQVIVVEEMAARNVVETDVVMEQTGRHPERRPVMVQVVAAELVQVPVADHAGMVVVPPLTRAEPVATSESHAGVPAFVPVRMAPVAGFAVWAKAVVEEENITAPATGVGTVRLASGIVHVLVEVVGPEMAKNPLPVPPLLAGRIEAVVSLTRSTPDHEGWPAAFPWRSVVVVPWLAAASVAMVTPAQVAAPLALSERANWLVQLVPPYAVCAPVVVVEMINPVAFPDVGGP